MNTTESLFSNGKHGGLLFVVSLPESSDSFAGVMEMTRVGVLLTFMSLQKAGVKKPWPSDSMSFEVM